MQPRGGEVARRRPPRREGLSQPARSVFANDKGPPDAGAMDGPQLQRNGASNHGRAYLGWATVLPVDPGADPRGGRAVLRIHRSPMESGYTMIPNAALRDTRLSFTARGVLAELLSRPEDWQTSADAMWRQARKHRGNDAEGRRAFRGAFAELEAAGYLFRSKRREGSQYITVLDLYDRPRRRTDSGTSETGTSESGTSETGTSLRNTDHRKTDLRRTGGHEDSTGLVNTRLGAASGRENDDTDDDESGWTEHQAEVRAAELRQAAATQREAALNAAYDAVRVLSADDIRLALVAFERKRPAIYRRCRRNAIAQLEEKEPHKLKSSAAAHHVDCLSYMYALQHYSHRYQAPACLEKPLNGALRPLKALQQADR